MAINHHLAKHWMTTIMVLLLAFLCRHSGHTLQNALTLESSCVCPGYTVIFAECRVVSDSMSGTATIWRGSAFNCTGNEISLRHSLYQSRTAVAGCNNEAIVGKGVGVEDNHYTSQLNITISSNMIGKTVECVLDNSEEERMVGSLLIATPDPFPPPNALFISQVDFMLGNITFNWNQVITNCADVKYNIKAVNCGTCPKTTIYTNVTCTDLPANSSMCKFSVQTVVCEEIAGNFSNEIILNLWRLPSTTPPLPTKNSSFILLMAITTILLVIIIVIVSLLFFKKFQKRVSCFKPGLNESNLQNQHDMENDYSHSMNSVTIRIFDNEKMGTYGLDDKTINEQDQTTANMMDQPPNLNTLLHALQGQVLSKWYSFGLALGVPKAILDQLTDYSEKDSLIEVLDYWMTHHPSQPSWQEVSDAQHKLSIIL